MNIRYALLAILMTVGPVMIGPAAAGADPVNTNVDKGGPSLAGMRAHLFRNDSAALSDDVLQRRQQDLINAFAGPDPTNAALVVVEVSGPPGGATRSKVRLVAQEQGRKPTRLLDQAQSIPVFNDKGRVFLGFWLMPGGCAPVLLTATITEQPAAKPMQKTLEYVCNE